MADAAPELRFQVWKTVAGERKLVAIFAEWLDALNYAADMYQAGDPEVVSLPPEKSLMSEKPHKGKIISWLKMPVGDGLYVIFGRSDGHPEFHGHDIRTSFVLSHDVETGEIETRNSRYTLVGEPIQ